MPLRVVTTALDVLGLLLVAAGGGVLAGRWLGWAGLLVTGLVVLAGSQLAARASAPRKGGRS